VIVRARNVDDLAALGGWATVEELAEFFGCSRAQMYADVAAGRTPFPVVRIGRKIRIPTAPVLALFGVEPSPNHNPNSAEGAGRTRLQPEPSGVEDDGKDQSTRRFRAV
jgi:excisionase family DNA binding protein